MRISRIFSCIQSQGLEDGWLEDRIWGNILMPRNSKTFLPKPSIYGPSTGFGSINRENP